MINPVNPLIRLILFKTVEIDENIINAKPLFHKSPLAPASITLIKLSRIFVAN